MKKTIVFGIIFLAMLFSVNAAVCVNNSSTYVSGDAFTICDNYATTSKLIPRYWNGALIGYTNAVRVTFDPDITKYNLTAKEIVTKKGMRVNKTTWCDTTDIIANHQGLLQYNETLKTALFDNLFKLNNSFVGIQQCHVRFDSQGTSKTVDLGFYK